jgi:hypothetical protein
VLLPRCYRIESSPAVAEKTAATGSGVEEEELDGEEAEKVA